MNVTFYLLNIILVMDALPLKEVYLLRKNLMKIFHYKEQKIVNIMEE